MVPTSFDLALVIAFGAFLAGYLGTLLLIPVLRRGGIVDIPNARSSHKEPTSRGGGLAILAGIGVGFTIAAVVGFPLPLLSILAATAVVGLIGLIDDCKGGISVPLRLAMQVCLAAWVVVPAGGLERCPLPPPANFAVGGAGTVLAVIWVVAVCNIYNFLDGMDGYAASQGAVAGLGLTLLGVGSTAAAGAAILGACLGFLIHNWHPARVFMGDVGSTTLGFLIAALPFGLPASQREQMVFAAAIFLWFFLMDGTYTLCLRLWRREKIWQAHRCHLYQRLLQTGKRPDQLVARFGIASLTLVAVEALAHRESNTTLHWLALAGALLGFAAYVVWVRSRETGLAPDSAGGPSGSAWLAAVGVGGIHASRGTGRRWNEGTPRDKACCMDLPSPDATGTPAGADRRLAEDQLGEERTCR